VLMSQSRMKTSRPCAPSPHQLQSPDPGQIPVTINGPSNRRLFYDGLWGLGRGAYLTVVALHVIVSVHGHHTDGLI
jgi:hypothetical protein